MAHGAPGRGQARDGPLPYPVLGVEFEFKRRAEPRVGCRFHAKNKGLAVRKPRAKPRASPDSISVPTRAQPTFKPRANPGPPRNQFPCRAPWICKGWPGGKTEFSVSETLLKIPTTF